MPKCATESGMVCSALLLVARAIAGCGLLLAGMFKLKGDHLAFALAMESFELFPRAVIPPLSYFVPMFEIVLGVTLLLGVWARQSGLLATLLFTAFTVALASVLLRGMDVDCGCFGGLFGGSEVTWLTIFRNSVFIAASAAVMVWGAGRVALCGGMKDEG